MNLMLLLKILIFSIKKLFHKQTNDLLESKKINWKNLIAPLKHTPLLRTHDYYVKVSKKTLLAYATLKAKTKQKEKTRKKKNEKRFT